MRLAACILAASAALASVAHAGESVALKGRGILVITASQTIAVPGRTDHQVIPSVMDGSIVADAGSLFDKARYQVIDLVDTAGMVNGGYKTITLVDGGMIFARYLTTGGGGTHYTGTWEITGGTGRYEKATGSGSWDGTFIADTVLLDEMDGTLALP